jgi:hypothetical protein
MIFALRCEYGSSVYPAMSNNWSEEKYFNTYVCWWPFIWLPVEENQEVWNSSLNSVKIVLYADGNFWGVEFNYHKQGNINCHACHWTISVEINAGKII